MMRLATGLATGAGAVALVALTAGPAAADSIPETSVDYWCDSSDGSTVFDLTLYTYGVPGVSNSLNFVVDLDGQTVEDVVVAPERTLVLDAVDWKYPGEPPTQLDVWVYYSPEEWFDGTDHWEPAGSWDLAFVEECRAEQQPQAPSQPPPSSQPSVPESGSADGGESSTSARAPQTEEASPPPGGAGDEAELEPAAQVEELTPAAQSEPALGGLTGALIGAAAVVIGAAVIAGAFLAGRLIGR